MKFIISANHPRTANYYSVVTTDDDNLINSEVVRLSRQGYVSILTRELTDEEYRVYEPVLKAMGATNE